MSEMTYGGQSIVPTPIISEVTRNYVTTDSGELIGFNYTITLRGVIYSAQGFEALMTAKTEFSEKWDCPGQQLVITCEAQDVLTACISSIDSLVFSETRNNWTSSISYTLSLTASSVSTMPACSLDHNLKSASDDWQISEDTQSFFLNLTGETPVPRRFIISRNLSASANNYANSTGDECVTGEGWSIAKDWVDEQLGFRSDMFPEYHCLTGYDLYNHARVYSIGRLSGSYSVNENWVLVEQISGESIPAFETFTVTVQSQEENNISAVAIEGSINGYEDATFVDGCKVVNINKYDNAITMWDQVRPNIHERAQHLSELTLRVFPVSSTITHLPAVGEIRYSYTYDNNVPCLEIDTGNCVLRRENIDISYANPADVYAEFYILGRPCPLLQNLGLRTKGSKTLSIDLLLSCDNLCPSDPEFFVSPAEDVVDDLVQACYDQLTGDYETVVVDSDQEGWNPKVGSYFRSVTWSYADCCENTG